MSGHGPPTRKSSSKSWESFVCVCACASTACVRTPARTRAHGACVHRERERGLGRETYIHVHQHTWNCPWMSPTTVTGDEMRGMLGASIRISLQRRHSCVTSSSSSGSSAQQRSKHSSRSSISLGAPPESSPLAQGYQLDRLGPPPRLRLRSHRGKGR